MFVFWMTMCPKRADMISSRDRSRRRSVAGESLISRDPFDAGELPPSKSESDVSAAAQYPPSREWSAAPLHPKARRRSRGRPLDPRWVVAPDSSTLRSLKKPSAYAAPFHLPFLWEMARE